MDKGFVIMAQGDDYVTCAKALERSIKNVMPDANVTIVTTQMLPYGDQDPTSDWKLINDWQVYEASPYEYTIKLEADMYLPQSIEYWWDVLKDRDVVVSTTMRDFRQDISNVRAYRRFIDDNYLPDVYNAITYFKKSDLAKEFYATVRTLFENWDEVKATLKCNPKEPATTDWVYALACHIHGVENTTLPNFDEFSIVHMKQYVNGLPTNDWTDTFVYEILPHTLRVNTVPQQYPFHYHIKSFAKQILENLK
jgi:hypothetical protein